MCSAPAKGVIRAVKKKKTTPSSSSLLASEETRTLWAFTLSEVSESVTSRRNIRENLEVWAGKIRPDTHSSATSPDSMMSGINRDSRYFQA